MYLVFHGCYLVCSEVRGFVPIHNIVSDVKRIRAMDQLKPPESMCWQGNLAENWKMFEQRFRLYLSAIGYDSKAVKTKSSVLLHLLGEKGLEVYNTFKFEDGHEMNLDEIMAKFQAYCNSRRNVTFQRYIFFTYIHPQDTNLSRYVTTLKKLAEPCEFGTLKDSIIRDRIIFRTSTNDL